MLNQATQKLSKMHVRRNPNLSIQSTAAYSQLTPPIQSATSGAFLSPTVASRRGLLSRSPPASPSLPSLIPRHGKKLPQTSHTRLIKRVLIGAFAVILLLWLIVRQLHASAQSSSYDTDGEEWEMAGGTQLPQEPSIVAMADNAGKMRWTVSIPSNFDFPLRPAQYRDICHQAEELSKDMRQEAHTSAGFAKRMLNYYQKDQYYIDVQEAEEQALLPPSKPSGRPKGFVEDEMIADGLSTTGLKVCEKTLTYVLETEDAGFGNSLMRLWMSYGLAKAENRAFFIDDSRWLYGKYLSYFINPPTAGCLPPPKSHMVPCPHNARHIVVSGATVRSTFGHAFTEEWEDATKMRVQRQHKIFGLLRTGYEALFKLRTDDAKYVLNRALELYGDIKSEGGISIGMHVRHGDRHPLEYQYQKDYIPLDRYTDTAREIYIDLVESAGKKSKKRSLDAGNTLLTRHTTSKMVLASDDPLVYESSEVGPNSIRAQDRIVLATKAALEAAQGKKNPWIDEITGWEGGFYRDVFFSLGQPVGNANDMQKLDNDNVPEQAMKLRELVGRAYLLDLAVLGKADTMVCTVSSIGCRLLAVMMGWDKAIQQGNWRNVDGEFDWRGQDW
ncbi:uncharacterized protein EKO05_0008271 [Ascochyta rabiei]|uniref:Uncharacterized protein n=1 Tax=Didymella rabiei TaxID=5454 RepID=A0A163DF24_DIDRA|nr:uncharacterized protein EKO05_0008271 [Ascochyta rabiei]KZM23118.1 hypothetical protein ST47_g5768 [Ascochyta rabiei]UPX17946.1 hypothetical protein EKO05_0008271 [Ascochyta rabiei]